MLEGVRFVPRSARLRRGYAAREIAKRPPGRAIASSRTAVPPAPRGCAGSYAGCAAAPRGRVRHASKEMTSASAAITLQTGRRPTSSETRPPSTSVVSTPKA
jgi:hypothetical protein